MIDDEKLIELVRRYPELYDVNHQKYLDTALKVKIWTSIGIDMESDGPSVKTRWNNMRDTYRKSLRKLSNANVSIKKAKQYKYSDKLSFMKDYFEEKKSRSSIGQLDEADYNFDDLPEITDDCNDDEFELNLMDYQPNDADDSQSQKSEKSSSKRKRNGRTTEMVMKYILNKEASQTTTSIHPVDAFLSGIAPTLKTLNPYLLNLAKTEIFATVQKYELQMLQHQQQEFDPIALDGEIGASLVSDVNFMKKEK